jgi:hypothetical protein
MIATAPRSGRQAFRPIAEAFETMVPTIRRIALYRFRYAPRWRREELISDVIALAYFAFARLVERGKAARAYPTALADFAIRQAQDGRRIGCRQNVRDVMSCYAQRRKGFSVQPLPHKAPGADWEELLQDRKANPAEIAACRIDFCEWLVRLKRFKRQVALRLAGGATTGEAARYFRVSQARISQLRNELHQDWNKFQGVQEAA